VGIIALLVIVLLIGTVGYVVKIVKQEHEINDTQLLSSIKPCSFDFIELFDSSLGDDLTPHSLSTILSNLIF